VITIGSHARELSPHMAQGDVAIRHDATQFLARSRSGGHEIVRLDKFGL
jgi:formylmethanofuran dehydrogenase subunit C